MESTARFAGESAYDIVFAEDATGDPDIAMHVDSFQNVFRRIGRVRRTAHGAAALE